MKAQKHVLESVFDFLSHFVSFSLVGHLGVPAAALRKHFG